MYTGQLVNAAAQSGVLTEKLRLKIYRTGYSQSDIEKVVLTINGDLNKKNKQKLKAKSGYFVVGLGIDNSSLFYKGDFSLAQASPGNSTGPYLTVMYDNLINPNIGRFRLRNELVLSSLKYTLSNSDSYSKQTQEISFINAALGLSFLYNVYNKQKFQLYLGAGVRISSYINKRNSYTEKTGNDQQVIDFPVFKKISFPYLFKMGMIVNKRIEGYVTYIPKYQIVTNYFYFSGYITALQFGVNYHFRKKSKG